MTEKRKPLTRRQLREMERAAAARNEAESTDHDTTDTLFIPLSEAQEQSPEASEPEQSETEAPVAEPPATGQPGPVPPSAAAAEEQPAHQDAVADPGLETELINTSEAQDQPATQLSESVNAAPPPFSAPHDSVPTGSEHRDSEHTGSGPIDSEPTGSEVSASQPQPTEPVHEEAHQEDRDPEPTGQPAPEGPIYTSRRARRRAQRAEAGESEESLSELTRRALSLPMDQDSRDVDDESEVFDEFESDRMTKLRNAWGTAESFDLPAFNDLLGLGATQQPPAEEHAPEESSAEAHGAPTQDSGQLDSDQRTAHRDAQRRIESTGIMAPVTRNVEIVMPQGPPASEPTAQSAEPVTAPSKGSELGSGSATESSNTPVSAETAHGLEPLAYHDGGARRRTLGTSIVAGSTILAVGAIVFAFLL